MAPHWLDTTYEGLTELADLLDALTERVATLEEASQDDETPWIPEPPDNESGHAHLEHSHPGVAVVHHHDPNTGVAVPGPAASAPPP